MNSSNVCLECGAPLTAVDAGGLCPRCLLKLGLASQLASGSLVSTAAGLAPDGTFTDPFDFGGYRIVRLLGKGGMGAVYEAEHQLSGRRVALKVLGQTLDSPEMRQRFLREGQLAAAVRHPNVVAVFAAEEIDGAPVIAMELVPDGTLRDEVKRRGPLPIAEAVDATVQIIDGLEAAHAGGVLHRDIKPTNCFLAPGGNVKVGDFGLSVSTLVKAEAQLTQPGTVLGTPAFASPEQLRAAEVDVRSDIYSVGATLYSLLTGKPPHDAETLVALIAAALEKNPVEPRQLRSEIPRGLSEIVLRSLAKNPGTRFQNYDEFRRALLPFSSAAAIPAPLGIRFVAGVVDSFVTALPTLIALCALGMDLDSTFLSERSSRAALLVMLMLIWEIACVGIPEGLWGAGLGKALFGLRVLRPDGARPGLSRGLARSLIFSLFPRLALVVSWFTRTAAEYRHATIVGDTLPEDWLWQILFIALFVTMRRRNGYAAVQDLLTGTRVVLQAQRPARDPIPMPGSEPYMAGAQKIGPFSITTRRGDLALGHDELLRRRVWIRFVSPDAAAIDPRRRDLNRPARLRWLAGRRSADENWDAFEAPEGMPLTAYLDGQQSWKRVRAWLLDLAEELRAGLDDETAPDAIGFDRIWLTHDGHAVLLEFPAPGSAPAAATSLRNQNDALTFLDQIATACVRKRVPVHAQEILTALREHRFESVALAAGNLHAALHKPTEISTRRRLLSVVVAPAAAVVGAMVVSYLVAFDIQRFETMWRNEYPGRTSIRQIFEVAHRDSDDPLKIATASVTVLAAKYRDVIQDDAFWDRVETDAVTTREQKLLAKGAVKDLTNLSPEEVRKAEALLEPHLLALQRYERNVITLFAPAFFYGLLAAGGMVGIVTGLLFSTPLGLQLNQLAIVTANGTRASRWRVLLRTVVGWSPAIIGAAAASMLQFMNYEPLVFWTIVGLPFLVMLVAAVLMVRSPERAPHDYLTRTWLVPR